MQWLGVVVVVAGCVAVLAGFGITFPIVMVVIGLVFARTTRTMRRQLRE
jgi:hypothetical protein